MTHPNLKFIALAAIAAVCAAAPSWAADRDAELRARFEADRTACLTGQTHQAQSTCLQEATNAYAEARRGRLDDVGADYQRNQMLRCEALKGDEKSACVARMRGQGKVTGSVESGGILRELVIVEPGVPPASAPKP